MPGVLSCCSMTSGIRELLLGLLTLLHDDIQFSKDPKE